MSLLKDSIEKGLIYSEKYIYTPNHIIGDDRLQLADIILLGVILSNSLPGSPYRKEDGDGVYIQMSLEELATETGSITRTISRMLNRLEEAEYIKRKTVVGKVNKTYVL